MSILLQVSASLASPRVVSDCLTPAAKGAVNFVLAMCLLEAIIFYGLAQTVHKRARGFHAFAFLLMLIPALGYASLLAGYGLVTDAGPDADRCFHTARWVSLLLELPLLVTTAALFAGVVAFDITPLAVAAFIIAASGLAGGLVPGDYRWVMLAIAGLAAVPVLRSLWHRFYLYEGDTAGAFDHEYASVVSNRLAFLCSAMFLYILVLVVFWPLCEGTGLLHSSTELLVLSICDVVFISAFNISLLSDRESTDKMAEYHARSMGWLRPSGSSNSDHSTQGETCRSQCQASRAATRTHTHTNEKCGHSRSPPVHDQSSAAPSSAQMSRELEARF